MAVSRSSEWELQIYKFRLDVRKNFIMIGSIHKWNGAALGGSDSLLGML